MPGLPNISIEGQQMTLDARRDTIDFRDLMYIPTLIEVPPRIPLEQYLAFAVPILSQGQEGACTGFGLATVVHYLMRTRKVDRDETCVSMRMLYEMAKRYDEWPGETYSGSSARGAMKGWHKHGVCSDSLWEYKAGNVDRLLNQGRAEEARNRPLGAYFRVNHKDLVCMHSAISEVGILYVTANVHEGWGKVDDQGVIPYTSETKVRGGHAFAIVAYDRDGFWIQNSWSASWGKGGFAKVTYDDWLANGMDCWVARLGVPVKRLGEEASAITQSPGAHQSGAYSYVDLQPHIISLDNDGRLNDRGTYGTTKADVKRIFERDIPRITKDWDAVRILLYAHGGLVGESAFLQRVAEYRSAILQEQIYPIAFIWHTDLWSTVTNILKEAVEQRRPEGPLESALDFMLDRLDDTLEVIVHGLKAKKLWDEMKENGWRATLSADGGARLIARHLAQLMEEVPNVEVHVAGHSAGSIFLAPLVQYFTSKGKIGGAGWGGTQGLGKKITTCTLWAPSIRIQDFHETYYPAIKSGVIERFSLYTLTDEAERCDHCANIYRKSLLYFVSNALEDGYGVPILGMEKFVQDDDDLMALLDSGKARWVRAPDDKNDPGESKARRHGDFDDDPSTLMSTLKDILPRREMPKENVFKFERSQSSLRDRRKQLG